MFVFTFVIILFVYSFICLLINSFLYQLVLFSSSSSVVCACLCCSEKCVIWEDEKKREEMFDEKMWYDSIKEEFCDDVISVNMCENQRSCGDSIDECVRRGEKTGVDK